MSENSFKNDADQDPDQLEKPDQDTQTDPSDDTPTADGGEASAQEGR